MLNESQKSILIAELQKPVYTGLSAEQCRDYLRNTQVATTKSVEYTHVASYLMLVNKYLSLMESVLPSARVFKLAMQTFDTFDIAKPGVELVINNSLDALIADSLIDATDKAAILNLTAGQSISLAQKLGISNVSTGDIESI